MKKAQLTLLVLLTVAAAITVGCGNSNSIPTFSKLPFSSDRVANPSTPLFLMNLDGSSVTPVAFTLPDGMYSPSISADFKTVAFTSDGEVWVSNSDGTSQTQLTDNASSDFWTYFAKISPDGKKIVFGLWNNTSYHFWIMNADGSGKLDLTSTLPDGMTGCYSGSFSADSKQIALACYGDEADGIYLINPDGSHLSTVTTQNAFLDTPMFSPDGQHILFVSFGGGPAVASHKPSFNLARAAGRKRPVRDGGLPPTQGVFSVNLDGTNSTLIVANCYEAEILNSTLYYTTFNSDLDLSQISKSNLDGTGAVSVSDGTADDWLALSSD